MLTGDRASCWTIFYPSNVTCPYYMPIPKSPNFGKLQMALKGFEFRRPSAEFFSGQEK